MHSGASILLRPQNWASTPICPLVLKTLWAEDDVQQHPGENVFGVNVADARGFGERRHLVAQWNEFLAHATLVAGREDGLAFPWFVIFKNVPNHDRQEFLVP